MNKNPLVTVYIPTYNRIELLKRAVTSVLNQTYKNIEIIVVDDCSSDATFDYMTNLSKENEKIKYIRNQKNSGACVSRNKAIKAAQGEFITGLDDDDYFLANRIELFLKNWDKYINENSKICCLFSELEVLVDNNQKKRTKKPNIINQNDLLLTNYIGSQVFTKTKLLKTILFDELLPMWQDLDCWIRLLNNGNYAKNIHSVTYVFDQSHPHERISKKKVSKVYDTFEYLILKYNLSNKQRAILQGQIYTYDLKNLNLSDLITLPLTHYNIKATMILYKKFIKKMVSND
jgi:glycosyltransferase involved in cell wall biosynthesis